MYVRPPEARSDGLHQEKLNICSVRGHSCSRAPNRSKEIVENLFAFKFQTSSLRLEILTSLHTNEEKVENSVQNI